MKKLIEVSPGCFGNNLTFSGWAHFAKIVDTIMATTLSATYKVYLIEAYAYHFPKDYIAGITTHQGPPPEIGWWPSLNGIRWWDGKYWSISAGTDEDLGNVAWAAQNKAIKQDWEWIPRWW